MADKPAQRPQRLPWLGERRGRNWRKLVIGERIVNKHGELTDWEIAGKPFRREPYAVLCRIPVVCLACGTLTDRYLNDLIQGESRRCQPCHFAGKKAPRAG